jgi:CBS domain-containing protein
MSKANVGAIAVLDAGKLVGIFSERDVVSRIVVEGRNPDDTRVDSVMTKDLFVAAPDDNINDALQKMHECNCRHLPVVHRGKLVGMISIRDLLKVDDDANRARASFLNELVTYSPDYET